jgi:hypothetical protein
MFPLDFSETAKGDSQNFKAGVDQYEVNRQVNAKAETSSELAEHGDNNYTVLNLT